MRYIEIRDHLEVYFMNEEHINGKRFYPQTLDPAGAWIFSAVVRRISCNCTICVTMPAWFME